MRKLKVNIYTSFGGTHKSVEFEIDDEADDYEAEQLIETAPIAVDGIVVIVNNNNPLENLEIQEIQGLYLEYIDTWDEILDN